MTLEERLRSLLESHCVTINDQVDAIGRLLRQMTEPRAVQTASIRNALDITHHIKGASGSMGYQELSTKAAALEQSLQNLDRQVGQITAAKLQITLDLLDALERIARSTTPEMSALYNADLTGLAEKQRVARGGRLASK
jgi:chemotaxis protein histidine kinase CheA